MGIYFYTVYYYYSCMNIYQAVTLHESPYKQKCASNSTIDADSGQEETLIRNNQMCWVKISKQDTHPQALNICPYCLQIVTLEEPRVLSRLQEGSQFLAHYRCVSLKNNSLIVQFTEYTRTALSLNYFNKLPSMVHQIGCRQYLVQLSIEHLVSSSKIYQTSKKMLENKNWLRFQIQQSRMSGYEANYIILPLKKLKCSIKIKPLFANSKFKSCQMYFKINLTQEKQKRCFVKFQLDNIAFVGQFQIIQNNLERAQIINKMNYKYKRPYEEQSFVKFKGFYINFKDSSSQQIMQLTKNTEKEEIKSEKDMFNENYQPQIQQFTVEEQILLHQSPQIMMKQESTIMYEQYEFISYIKTQAGSKQFQKKVKSLKNSQIENIISFILPHLEEVILNDYANYMFQSLLGTCTFEQRMAIIVKVGVILTKLVCRQQGTFVFQQLISFLTNKQQFQSICKSVVKDFKLISLDNYGNHFMRKLVQNMPKQMLSFFLPSIYQNFEELAKNRNAVCVMKSILRVLKQGQTLNSQISYEMKRFLDTLTFNTQSLINDQFGNYLIQEVYEQIDVKRLRGISQYIVSYFTYYSCERFSNNVVFNCVKKYWQKNPEIFKTLKQSLEYKHISYMYQNKEGNKILLEIMQLPIQLGLKDKISSAIRNESPSKFNNRRWISISGKCKTGGVGTNYNSFSEAHTFSKKRHYN